MLSIITMNLRYQNPDDGINEFVNRFSIIRECILKEKPDLIGFQELREGMYHTMKEALPDYTFFGEIRETRQNGERNSIAYLNKRLSLVSSGTFWLSDDPSKPASRFPESNSSPRICTWGIFDFLPANTRIAHYNTHLDNRYGDLRKKQMNVILSHIRDFKQKPSTANIPIFLTGDLNATPDDSLYQDILNYEGLSLIDVTRDIAPTYHGFGKETPQKIDYIFVDSQAAKGISKVFSIHKYEDGVYLSDHDAIRIDWEL